jgi:hypothetical protein
MASTIMFSMGCPILKVKRLLNAGFAWNFRPIHDQFHGGGCRDHAKNALHQLPAAYTAAAIKDGNPLLTASVVPFLPSAGSNPRVERLRAEITAARTRLQAASNRADWTDISLQIGALLLEAKDLVPTGTAINDWFKTNKLDFYSANERIALSGLASKPEIGRTVLNQTNKLTYQTTWNQNRHLYGVPGAMKPENPEEREHKRKTYAPRNRMMIHYTLKLGEETIAKIRGTSLDSSKEYDELLMLNRGAELGELTPIVRQLVEDAAAGKQVSALALSAKQFGVLPRRVVKDLRMGWAKRMTASWQLATLQEKADLIVHLLQAMSKTEAGEIIEYLIDHVNLKDEP